MRASRKPPRGARPRSWEIAHLCRLDFMAYRSSRHDRWIIVGDFIVASECIKASGETESAKERASERGWPHTRKSRRYRSNGQDSPAFVSNARLDSQRATRRSAVSRGTASSGRRVFIRAAAAAARSRLSIFASRLSSAALRRPFNLPSRTSEKSSICARAASACIRRLGHLLKTDSM